MKLMNKIIKIIIGMIALIIIISVYFIIQNDKTDRNIVKTENTTSSNQKLEAESNHFEQDEKPIYQEKISLNDIDGNGKNYVFTYKDELYQATYTKDNWHIVDSYKITDHDDLTMICKALIEVHPIHGKDRKSYRTVEDLVYEWEQHNLAYRILPEDSQWKKSAKDVDLDWADEGSSIEEMYERRSGKNLRDVLKDIKIFE